MMVDVVYKLKHLPTGLYYQPVKGRWKGHKTNLGIRGKVYTTKTYPNIKKKFSVDVSESLIKKYNIKFRDESWGNILDTSPEDWEIETFELKKLES